MIKKTKSITRFQSTIINFYFQQQGSCCFDNFSLSMFVAHLLSTKQINSFMSRYQIFRIALLNLSTAEWHRRGVSLNKQTPARTSSTTATTTSGGVEHNLPIDLETFHKHYAVVLVDSTGFLNLAARLSKFTFLKLKHDAQLSLSLLNDESTDHFEDLFIKEHYFSICYDSLIK